MIAFVMALCWLGVFQSLLLSVYFLSASRKSSSQILLGLTMGMVALRAAKSTLFLSYPNVPLWIINTGFSAHAAIGPLLLLYVQSLNATFRFKKWHWLHFIPCVAVLIFSPRLSLDSFWYRGGYAVLLIYTFGYTLLYVYFFMKEAKSIGLHSKDALRWISALLITLTLFQISYFSNYMLRLTDYLSGPTLYSILIYMITFVVIKNNQTFQADRKRKYRHINLSDAELDSKLQLIDRAMEQHKPYTDIEFSVQKLSELTDLPSYIISTALSVKAGRNFNQYVNSFRIRDAKLKLSDSAFDNLTIAAIAYDCGFNSLSSFNTAFKKQTGTTPSLFKSQRDRLGAQSVTNSRKSVTDS